MLVLDDICDDEIRDSFKLFNFVFEDDRAMNEVKLLCIKYQVQVEDIVDEWIAHFAQGRSKIQAVTITKAQIAHFESTRLVKRNQKPASSTPLSKTPISNQNNSPFRTPNNVHRSSKQYSGSASNNRYTVDQETSFSSGKIDFNDYGTDEKSARKTEKPAVAFCDRTNKGNVVAALGNLPEGLTWDNLPKASTYIHIFPKDSSSYLSKPYPFMFVKYQDVALALNNKLDELGEEMAISYDISEYSSPTVIGEKTHTLGRLLPGPEGNLNPRNMWLQSSSTFHNGAKARLDVDLTEQLSLFPGQIIACHGHGNGAAFAVDKIFQGVLPPSVKIDLPPSSTLHLLVACGPFNLLNEPTPEPLHELKKYIKQSKPDLVILLGPFVDSKLTQDEQFLQEHTLEEHFKSIATIIIEEIMEELKVIVIMVPSAGQLIGMPIYPVAPYTFEDCVVNPNFFTKPEFDRRIMFVPEPALINVHGIIIGLTSTDIISHLCQKELFNNMKDERLPRMAGHLLMQQSFYPLYPTEVAADVCALHKYAKMPVKPHLLITPSDLKGFAKTVHGTVCLNPERLAKGYMGGSFARVFISTANSNPGSDGASISSLEGRIAAEIVRI